MSQLIAELSPDQRTALRVHTRYALLELCSRTVGHALVGRPLQARDVVGWDYSHLNRATPARLHTGPVQPGVWREVARRTLLPNEGIAVWGFAAYRRESLIDVVRLGLGQAMTLSELPTTELAVIERRDPDRVRRRSGWIDPPVCWAPQQVLTVAVLSDQGIPEDEDFGLLGLVVEPSGKTVMPDAYTGHGMA